MTIDMRKQTRFTKSKVATKKYVKKQLNALIERKFHLRTFTAEEPSYDNPVMIDISAIVQDTTTSPDTGRNGDRVKVKSIKWLGNILGRSTNTVSIVRFVIFQWFGSDATAPTATDVIGVNNGAMGANSAVYAMYNHDKRHLFRVLYDKRYKIGSTTDQEVDYYKLFKGQINVGLKAKKRLCRNHINYFAGGTDGQNKFYCLMISNWADASGTEPQVNCRFKLNFTDA